MAKRTAVQNNSEGKSAKQRLIDIARPGKRERPRPVRDVRAEIEELTEEEARLNRQRDDLISELARDLTGPNADNLTRQIGDLDIRLGAVRRRKEWNRRDLYQAQARAGDTRRRPRP